MAINRKMVDNVLPFPKRIPLHDMWIGLVSELTGRAIYVETPFMYYLSSAKSVSHNVNNSLFYKIFYSSVFAYLFDFNFCFRNGGDFF